MVSKVIFWKKFTRDFHVKNEAIFFIGDFHVKLKVSFEFFTRDFPVKKTRASLARAAFRRVSFITMGVGGR